MQAVPDDLGDLLRRHRFDAGLTQQELASRAGVSIRTLRDIEQNRISHPRKRSLWRLADALGLVAEAREALLSALPGPAGSADDRLHIGILGPLSVRRGAVAIDAGPPMQRRLLSLLAVHRRQVVPGAEIIDALWDDRPPRTSQSLVQGYVGQLRTLLQVDGRAGGSGPIISASYGGYRLEISTAQLDLGRFDDLAATARQAQAHGDGDTAFGLFQQAMRCWRGPVLADAGPRIRQLPAAVAASQRRLSVALDAADLAIDLGRYQEAAAWLWPLGREEPLHEGLHARLMLVLAGCGQQTEALRLYHGIKSQLAEELGVEPGAEITAAYLRVLRRQVGTGPAEAAPDDFPAPARQPTIPGQLPADIPGFTGRTADLTRLDKLLTGLGGRAAVTCVIAGTAGVGKTALAVHWAHRAARHFPDGQLYVNLRGFDPAGPAIDPAEAVRGFLDAFEVPAQQIPAGLQAQVGLYRSLLAGRRVLVVLDNARDADQVRPLLPGASGCLVLVTSRNQMLSLIATDGAHPLPLDLLPDGEARQLLVERLGEERVAAGAAAAEEIVTRCARLPLALAIVAARAAANPGFSLDALAKELRDAHGGLDALVGGDGAANVRAVFSCSYRALDAEAARLFRLLGIHSGPDIGTPAAASLAGVPAGRVRPLLAELARAHLVSEHAPGRFALHDLLRAYAVELAHEVDPLPTRRAAIHGALEHYLHSAHAASLRLEPLRRPINPVMSSPGTTPESPAGYEEAKAWLTVEHPVLLAAIDQAAGSGFDTHAWQLASAIATFLERQGHWHDLVTSQRVALAAARRLADRDGQANSHRSLGLAYGQLGRYGDARAELLRALALFVELGDQTGAANTHRSLGWVCDRQDLHQDALHHDQQALALYRALGHRAGQARALNAVGWDYVRLGDHARALIHCRLALDLIRELGDRHGEANTLDSVGYAYHHLGDHGQAITCYRQALDLFRELGDRYYEADTLTRLGDTHHAAGDPGAAREAWQRALDLLGALGHPDAEKVRQKLHGPASHHSGTSHG